MALPKAIKPAKKIDATLTVADKKTIDDGLDALEIQVDKLLPVYNPGSKEVREDILSHNPTFRDFIMMAEKVEK